jgi:hypothetical protein
MTLTEVMIAMGVLTVVMAIFTGAILNVYRSVDQGESGAATQSQLHVAVQRLDADLRYASAITTPNPEAIAGAWYVEYLTTDPATSQPQCRQLRLAPEAGAGTSGVLQLLRWNPGEPAPAAGTAGQTLASHLVLPGGGVPAPFELQKPGPNPAPAAGEGFDPDYMRLRLRLTAHTGAATAGAEFTFTALNTSRDTAESGQDHDAVAAKNVCLEGRPL